MRYSLTDRQKEMLRSIAPGLRKPDGTVKTDWKIVNDRGEIIDIIGLDDKLRGEFWTTASVADLDDFVDCRLFRFKGDRAYTLSASKIIDVVDSNFGEDEIEMPVQSNSEHSSQLTFDPIFGLPPKSSQYQADIFMLMPFHKSFRPVYDEHVKPMIQNLSLTINRGDDFFSKHSIVTDIWSAIYHSRLVIADCTDKNAQCVL